MKKAIKIVATYISGRFIAASIVMMTGMLIIPVFAVNVQPGQSYSGQVKLVFPGAGTSFVLPAGWKGGIPNGKEVFLLGNNSIRGAGIVGIRNQAAAAVLLEMRRPIPFLGSTQLILQGSVQRKGNVLIGLYRVQGAQVPMLAYVVSVFGNSGRVVSFLVAARETNINQLQQDVKIMMSSVVIGQPAAPPPIKQPTGNNASNSRLGRLLNGMKLTYMQTGSTTRTRIDLYLCKNGTFYRTTNYGGVSGSASMAGRKANRGRWFMSGT